MTAKVTGPMVKMTKATCSQRTRCWGNVIGVCLERRGPPDSVIASRDPAPGGSSARPLGQEPGVDKCGEADDYRDAAADHVTALVDVAAHVQEARSRAGEPEHADDDRDDADDGQDDDQRALGAGTAIACRTHTSSLGTLSP